MAVKYFKINHEKYGYDLLALFQSFYPESSWQLVFPGCREQIIKEAEKIGFFAELIFEEGDNAPVEVCFNGSAGQETDGASADAKTGHADREIIRYPGGLGADLKEGFGNWLYDKLVKRTCKTLPWGTLNGVRPTKLAYQRLQAGQSPEEIIDYYVSERRTSHEKAVLATGIAQREREILKGLDLSDGYSLYIGIPFCPTTCLYCSFTSYPIAGFRKEVERYLDCLIKELRAVSEMKKGHMPDTVYIGGGTPTTLEPGQLDRLLSALHELFDLGKVKEFTVEAGRADSITREKLEVLKKHDVSRISINPQTFCQETLDIIGRKASVKQVLDIWPVARELGFDNINMDIILGLPGEGEDEVRHTVEKITELRPDSLTVHSLAIKRASALSKWIEENGKEALKNSDEVMKIASAGAAEMGLIPYYLYRQKNMSGNLENEGFASPGKYGIYNILIMEELQSIIACGAGCVSKRVYYEDGRISRIERCENVKEVKMYCDKIDAMIEKKKELF